MESWRCFVAVPLGDDLRRDLAAMVARWRAEPSAPNLRWTHSAGWHITLRFLGATDPDAIPTLADQLRSATSAVAPFTVAGGGLGTFPGPARARSLWYGVADPGRRLAALAAAVGADGPFRPHVTLARARETRLTEWLAGRMVPTGIIAVDRIELLRSPLGSGPARYEVLASLPLGGAGSVRG